MFQPADSATVDDAGSFRSATMCTMKDTDSELQSELNVASYVNGDAEKFHLMFLGFGLAGLTLSYAAFNKIHKNDESQKALLEAV